ncbi:hypothetical protein DL98DRAFT_538172 [Cadophora sp. DSE1049]|nr:hypothetical protein DL98DRAFT_538172 [Cadophora sp. DSE1049]
MSSPPAGSGPSSGRSPAPPLENKVVNPKPMSKMSALARAKAKRAKFLASAMDYSQPPPDTTQSTEKNASPTSPTSPTPETSILFKKVESVTLPTGLWHAKNPTLTYSTGYSFASNQREITQGTKSSTYEASTYDDETEYAHGNQGKNDDDEDGVAKSEAAFLASSRRKMAAALKGYDVPNDDDDVDEEEESPYLSKYKSEARDEYSEEEMEPKKAVSKSKAVVSIGSDFKVFIVLILANGYPSMQSKSAMTSTNTSSLKSTVRGYISQDDEHDEEELDPSRTASKKRSASTFDGNSPKAHSKRAKAKLSGVNDFKPRTPLPRSRASTASFKKNNEPGDVTKGVASGAKDDTVEEEDPWAWIKDVKN